MVKYSIEATVRRDTLTAVNKLANKSAEALCDELGAEYVEISSHLGARTHPTNPIANHAGWQGKIFKINGSDKKYPNLKESTGYPDDILGLGGVNCRHRMFPFFSGISTPNPIQYDEEENKRIYELTQKQRAMERRMRKLKKEQAAAKAIGDTETAAKLKTKISEQSKRIDEFCKKNGLKRDFSRELVKEQIVKNKSVANSENSGIIKTGDDNMGLSLEIDKFTPCLVRRSSGEIVNTNYSVADSGELKFLNKKGWKFNWRSKDLKNSTVYKLCLENDDEIQGLIAVTDYPRDRALYINIAESAPHNLGKNKEFEGVGGHLFAIAVNESVKKGYDGFLFLDAKNMELVSYYHEKFGATLLGMPHPYRMFIDEESAKKLVKIYTLKGE